MYLLYMSQKFAIVGVQELTSAMAETDLISDRNQKRNIIAYTVCIACFQIIGIVGILPLVIGRANLDELVGNTQFTPTGRHFDRSVVAVGWTTGLHLICLQL
jgi:hypothetical protein